MSDLVGLLLALTVVFAPLGLAWWLLREKATRRRPPRK
jgi:uncharacterized Tic20 family protein